MRIAPSINTFIVAGVYTITNQKINLENNFLINKRLSTPIGMNEPLFAIQFVDTDQNSHSWYYPTETDRDTDYNRIDNLTSKDASSTNSSLTSVYTTKIASNTATTLVDATPNRQKVVITNHSPFPLYLLEGTTPIVSDIDYIYRVQPNGIWISTDTADHIQGIWSIPEGITPTNTQKANILETS
jgi:hypothetical protein